jgi:hypothetical protein
MTGHTLAAQNKLARRAAVFSFFLNRRARGRPHKFVRKRNLCRCVLEILIGGGMILYSGASSFPHFAVGKHALGGSSGLSALSAHWQLSSTTKKIFLGQFQGGKRCVAAKFGSLHRRLSVCARALVAEKYILCYNPQVDFWLPAVALPILASSTTTPLCLHGGLHTAIQAQQFSPWVYEPAPKAGTLFSSFPPGTSMLGLAEKKLFGLSVSRTWSTGILCTRQIHFPRPSVVPPP